MAPQFCSPFCFFFVFPGLLSLTLTPPLSLIDLFSVCVCSTWFTKLSRGLEEKTFNIPQIKNATAKQCAVDTVNRYVHKGAVSNSAVWQYLVSEDATFNRVRVTLNRQFSAATSAKSTFLSYDQLLKMSRALGSGLLSQQRQVRVPNFVLPIPFVSLFFVAAASASCFLVLFL